MIALVPPADLLLRDDEALVLYDGRLIRLSPVATAVVELARDGIEFDTLVTALDERFGRPEAGSTREATLRVISDLITGDVLTWPEQPTGEPEEEPLT